MPKFKNLLKNRTHRDILVNTSGNYLGVIFALLYTLLLTRILTVTDFGVLSVLLAISYVLANILDFGVTAAIYAYLPDKLKNKPESLKFIKTNLLFLTVSAIMALVVLSLFILPLETFVFKLQVAKVYYYFAGIAVLFFVWQNFILNILYASQKFAYANIAVNLSHFIKMILLIALAMSGTISIINVIIVLGIAGPAIFFLIVILEIKGHLKNLFASPLSREDIKLKFTMTYFLSTQVFNIASRMDLFLVSYFLLSTDVGHYALSQKIVLAILTSVNSISQVLSPQFAAVQGREATIKLMKKSLLYMAIPALIFVAAILTPSFFYETFFTSEFKSATIITRALSFSYLFYGFALVPLLYFLYTVKKPIVMLIANIIFLIIVGLGNYFLIPKFSLFGPPITFLIAFLVIFFYTMISFARDIRK